MSNQIAGPAVQTREIPEGNALEISLPNFGYSYQVPISYGHAMVREWGLFNLVVYQYTLVFLAFYSQVGVYIDNHWEKDLISRLPLFLNPLPEDYPEPPLEILTDLEARKEWGRKF